MTPDERRAWVEEMADEDAVLWNDCDAAILGVHDGKVVYSRSGLVQVFVEQGMTEEEADEWVGYNIEGAYVGKKTPLIILDVGY